MQILPLLFFLFSAAAFGGDWGIAPDTDLDRILKKPQMISSSIYGETLDDNSRWVGVDADVHIVADKPFDLVIAQAKKLEDYARVFKWFKEVQVARLGEEIFLQSLLSVGVMGINVNTVNTMRMVETVDAPFRLLMDYTWYSGDGLLLPDFRGQWYFESVTVNGIQGTYIRYTAHGTVVKKYPFQETVMRMFVNAEHLDLMRQFLKALSRTM
jgi:hypothetical protein